MAGNRLISGGSDNCVKVWDLATLRCIYSRKMDAHVISLDSWERTPETIFIQLSNGSISKWTPETGDFSLLLSSSATGGLTIGVDGELYSGKSDGSIMVLEGTSKSAIKSFVGHSRPIERLRYYHPGFLVSSSKGEVKVWNVMNGTCVVTALGDDFDLIETIDSGATLLSLQPKCVISLNVQETIKALKVQNAISEANNTEEKEIFLAHCDLSSLPLELSSHRSYQHLTHLYINNNMLTRLGSGLAKLKFLQVIQAQHNRLANISSHLGKLSSLHTLLLGDNQLSYLPGEIGRISHLDLLDLSQNRLEYLPSSLAALSELTTLFLHDNCLGGAEGESKQGTFISNPTSPRLSPHDSSDTTKPIFSLSDHDEEKRKDATKSTTPLTLPTNPSQHLSPPHVHFVVPHSARTTTEADSIDSIYGGASTGRLAASTSSLLSPRGSGPTTSSTASFLHHATSSASFLLPGISEDNGTTSNGSTNSGSNSRNTSSPSSPGIPSSGHSSSGGPTSVGVGVTGPYQTTHSGLSSPSGISSSSGAIPGSSGGVGPTSIPTASSLANIPITARNLSLRPTISSREAGPVRGHIYSAKETGMAVSSPPPSGGSIGGQAGAISLSSPPHAQHSSPIGSPSQSNVANSSASAGTAYLPSTTSAMLKTTKSPRPLMTTADSSFFAPIGSGNGVKGSVRAGEGLSSSSNTVGANTSRFNASADSESSHALETPPSSSIITAPTTLPASSTPRAKTAVRSVSSASSSSTATTATNVSSSTTTTSIATHTDSATIALSSLGGMEPTLSPRSPRSPRRSPNTSERKKTKLKKDSTLPGSTTTAVEGLLSDSQTSPSTSTFTTPDSSLPNSPAISTRRKRGKSSRPLHKKKQSSSRRNAASTTTAANNGDDTAEEDTPKPTKPSKKKSSRKSALRSERPSSDPNASSNPADPSNPSQLNQSLELSNVDAEQAYVTPDLKNASVRKSMNRYSVMKVSAKWVEQAIIDSMAKEESGISSMGSIDGAFQIGEKSDPIPSVGASPAQSSVNTSVNASLLDADSDLPEGTSSNGMRLAIDRIPARQQSTILPGSGEMGLGDEAVGTSEGVKSKEFDSLVSAGVDELSGDVVLGDDTKGGVSEVVVDVEMYLKDDVVKNQVYFEEIDFGKLRSLKLLHLQANRLDALPRSLGECRSLTDLDLAENRLVEYNDWMCHLEGLVRLSLACNEIRRLPESFTKLTRLVELYLDENELEDLPNGVVKSFGLLRVLHVSHNQLMRLPHGFGKLPSLTELNLSHNNLMEFPTEVTMLKSLIFLAIDSNDLKSIPTSLFFLPNLKSLEARDNQLTSIPYHSLIHLECLQLDNNHIQAISKDIASLHNILDLSFNGNPIREIPEEIGALSHVIRLDLSNMPIAQIPDSVCLLPKLRKLILSGNPNMTWPSPSLVSQLETESLLEAMLKSRFGSLKPNDRHRLCFVGLQGSGKSSLFHFLKQGKVSKKNTIKPTKAAIDFDSWSPKQTWISSSSPTPPASSSSSSNLSSSSTLSSSTGLSSSSSNLNININASSPSSSSTTSSHTSSPTPILANNSSSSNPSSHNDKFVSSPSTSLLSPLTSPQKMLFNVWDFSGNEDYRIMHQLFLSEGAVFVLVWNLALDESRSTIDYWLHSIRCHAGPLAPVIIAATHSDNFKNLDDHPTLRLLESKYLNSTKYPNVRGIIAVSSTTGENVEKLGRKICHLSLELRRDLKVPASFHKVLASIPKDLPVTPIPAPIMDLTTMEKFLASKFGFDELTSAAALRYLHEVGAIINLQSINFGKDLSGVIVNPEYFAKIYSEIFSQNAKYMGGNDSQSTAANKDSTKSQGSLMGNRQATSNGWNQSGSAPGPHPRNIVASSEGSLKHDHLELIWKDTGLPSLAHYTFIAVLYKLEMCFDDGSHLQMSSRNFYQNLTTFPSFLSESAPENVPWKPLSAGSEEISLVLRLAFIPASLIPKLMCRVFSMLRPQSFWRNGFIVQSLPDVLQPNADPEMSAFLEIQPSKNEIHIWIRGSHMYSCMNLIIAAILNTLSSYHYPPSTSIHRHLQCAFKTNKETQVEIVAITMHKVEYEISRGVTLLQLTSADGHQVPLTHIHADLAEPITQFNTI